MQKLPTPKKTKRKFYNKYIYKVSMEIPGAPGLRYFDFNELIEYCSKPIKETFSYRERMVSDVISNKPTWIKLISVLDQYDVETFSKRVEGTILDFYTNDVNFYEKLCEEFGEYIRLLSEPKKGTEELLLSSHKQIFVNKLPFDAYQYRAYLLPHKVPNKNDRILLADWMEKQKPKITFSHSIRKWLIETDQNWDRRYIQVDSEQTILMIKLRSPQLIGQTFKYVLNR
jgi:hypothetical protein